MLHEPLKERARGRWPGVLAALGVPTKALRNRHGPCPACGGTDRFRFDDKAGTGSFFCSHCGPGDGIELVKRFCKVDFKGAARLIEQQIGVVPVVSKATTCAPADDQRKRRDMADLWARGQPMTIEDPGGRYLHDRTGWTEFPTCLRFSPDERYFDAGDRPTWHPMMVARVEPSDTATAEGERPALHRTYLGKFGGKAEVPNPRKMMGTMPTGAAVRLMRHVSVLGIAEGIETAISASVLFKAPVWAALSGGLLSDWSPPSNVRTVIAFGDNDGNFTGQAAAYALARRLNARSVTTSVELPLRPGTDWNDVLRERRQKVA